MALDELAAVMSSRTYCLGLDLHASIPSALPMIRSMFKGSSSGTNTLPTEIGAKDTSDKHRSTRFGRTSG
jgi:hypothetical protein